LHPETELAFVDGEAARLEELLLAGSLDVAVVARLDPAKKQMRHHRLYRERVVVVFPVGHRFERQEGVRLIDLKGESFLLRTNCEKRALLLEGCRRQGFEPKIAYRSEREDWIQVMVAAGRGVALMPENLHLGHRTLARPLVEPALHREVSLVSVAGRPYGAHVQHLMRAVRAHKWEEAATTATGREYRNACLAQETRFIVETPPANGAIDAISS
jgi:DNA-binding transcriptional LysR family regulator